MGASAQNVADMFINMPEGIMPMVDQPRRKELVGLKRLDMADAAAVLSYVQEEVKLTDLDEEYMKISIGEGVTYEIGRLPMEGNDSVYCFIKTLAAPEKTSACYIYNKVWEKIEEVSFEDVELTHRPDTMSAAEYEELLSFAEVKLVEAHFSNVTNEPYTLLLSQNFPMVNAEDKERLKAVRLQRNVKWNGKTFK